MYDMRWKPIHSGSTSRPLIMLAQYPAVADAASMKLIPRLSFRNPGSLIQLLLVLFCKTFGGMAVDILQKRKDQVDLAK